MKRIKKGGNPWGDPPKGFAKCEICGRWEQDLRRVGWESFWDRLKHGPIDMCSKCYEKV
jgi:hypothetical protein